MWIVFVAEPRVVSVEVNFLLDGLQVGLPLHLVHNEDALGPLETPGKGREVLFIAHDSGVQVDQVEEDSLGKFGEEALLAVLPDHEQRSDSDVEMVRKLGVERKVVLDPAS